MGLHRILACSCAALLVTWASVGLSGATHYKWINERGEPVYSDRPPPKGVDYEVVSTTSSFKRIVDGDEGAVPLETDPRVGNNFDQVNTAQKSKKNPEMCQRAKTNLESLSSSDQVKVRNDRGEIRMLSPEEMEVERQTARAQISVYCE